MVELIEKYNGIINDFIWGVPMILLLLGTGIYFSIRLNFVQITKIKEILRKFKKESRNNQKKGNISSIQAALIA